MSTDSFQHRKATAQIRVLKADGSLRRESCEYKSIKEKKRYANL